MSRLLLTALVISLVPAFASGQVINDSLVCPVDPVEMDPQRTLRALSLDLRGTMPSVDEYEALESVEDVPVSTIDDWLATEAFAERAVRRHRDLLWNNISNQRLLNNRVALRSSGGLYWRTQEALTYRGATVSCLDEPAEFDDAGNIQFQEDDGVRREGYVWVAPYWDTDNPIRVCAGDAQESSTSPSGNDCDRTSAYNDPGCGCGPNLRWCAPGAVQIAIVESFAQDVELRIRDNVLEDRPYLDLFQGNMAYVNGPMVHFLRYQTGHNRGLMLEPVPYPVDRLPDLSYEDIDVWVEVPLPPDHAGILTSPAFLLRFQTNRARANRFYSEFLCQPFVAPAGGLPASVSDELPHPDLQQRDGCAYCHAQLEPAAAYWGRWTSNGMGRLVESEFPMVRDDCAFCADRLTSCPPECSRYYLTRTVVAEERPFLGHLLPFVFLKPHHTPHVDTGPASLVDETVFDGRFTECTVRSTATWLLGRDLDAADDDWLEAVEQQFVSGDFSYRSLIRAIVTSPVYRRAL